MGAGNGAVRGQTVETRIGNVVVKGGGEEDLQMSPSLEWSEFDVAEVPAASTGRRSWGRQSPQEAKGSCPRQ